MRLAAALALASAIAACGPSEPQPAEPAATNAPAPTPAPASDRLTEVDPAEPRPDGKGLRPDLPFGTSRNVVLAAARARFGPPSAENRIEECGEGPVDFVEYGGLSLSFQDDRFVGWFARSPYRLRTGSGLRVGNARGELGAAKFEESTLGAEFEMPDGTRGLLDEKEGAVESLWAGSVCLFR